MKIVFFILYVGLNFIWFGFWYLRQKTSKKNQEVDLVLDGATILLHQVKDVKSTGQIFVQLLAPRVFISDQDHALIVTDDGAVDIFLPQKIGVYIKGVECFEEYASILEHLLSGDFAYWDQDCLSLKITLEDHQLNYEICDDFFAVLKQTETKPGIDFEEDRLGANSLRDGQLAEITDFSGTPFYSLSFQECIFHSYQIEKREDGFYYCQGKKILVKPQEETDMEQSIKVIYNKKMDCWVKYDKQDYDWFEEEGEEW
ncbi:MAG: hypothetical protein LBR25_06760 [Erysipelotrichaceae bacterium]|jgi:hypothetical protein|nr:hypothetical protein [Erysipelotrichaceae bacterium]